MRPNRRRMLIAISLVVGLAPLGFLAGGGDPPGLTAGSDEGLPWPWCGPDATPPPPARPYPDDIVPLPPNVLGPLIRAEPFADALVRVTAVGDAPLDLNDSTYRPDSTLDVRVDAVVLDDGSGDIKGDGVVEGVKAEWAVLVDLIESSRSGPVLAGLDGSRDLLGRLHLVFAFDARTGELLGARSGESVVEEFIASRADDEAAATQLIIDWNIEYARGEEGPVTTVFTALLEEFFGPTIDLPAPGTMAYWRAAPPLCRSLLDAPPEVLETLDGIEVAVRIPKGISQAEDALICLRTDFGGMGCSVMRPNPDSDVIRFDAWRDPGGGPVIVQLAKEVDGSNSWVQRTTLVKLPDADLDDGRSILVELPASLQGETYDEIGASLEAAGAG